MDRIAEASNGDSLVCAFSAGGCSEICTDESLTGKRNAGCTRDQIHIDTTHNDDRLFLKQHFSRPVQ
jgi:hypothetical protein